MADSFLRSRAPAWGAGFAIPDSRTILIRADKGNPRQTLRHELAHLALHHAVRVRVPLWFDEGYASIAAGEWGRLVTLQLNFVVAWGAIPDFYQLDRELRGGEWTAQTAYALSASAVALIAVRHPERSLEPFLARLVAGERFETALLASTGSTLGRFEVEWQRDVRRRYGVLTWLMAGGMWAVIAGGFLLAAWLRRRRDRPRRAALDVGWVVEEEEEEPSPGPPPLDRSPPAP